LCESTSLHASWRHYYATQLATRALDALLDLQSRHGETWLELLPRLEAHWRRAIEGGPRDAGVAAGLGGLLGTNPADRMSRLRVQLQGVLDAGGLNMTPEDLATEGGLVATSKLASHAKHAAHRDWTAQFQAWSSCHKQAFADGKLPLPDASAVAQCNTRHAARASKPIGPADTARHALELHQRKHARRACLESAPCWDFVVMRSQATCATPAANWLERGD
jgi:hypothetical protein